MNYENTYKGMFAKASYNLKTSYSYELAIDFLKKCKNIKSISDIGSGKGNLAESLINQKQEYDIQCYDLDCFLKTHIAESVTFTKLNLVKQEDLDKIKKCDLLFCLDVLEHVEEKYVKSILKTFSEKSKNVFLTIANHSDIIDGIELHLIQKDKIFWDEIILQYFNILSYEERYDARLMIYGLEKK